jgi:hypothetical protein
MHVARDEVLQQARCFSYREQILECGRCCHRHFGIQENTLMGKVHRKDDNPANRDPITGAPGSHPAGTAAGAAAGGVAGAAIGSAAGPVGTAVGAAVGAVAGGLAGHAAGEAVNPTVEDAYWREAHVREPYYHRDFSYDDYAPAYRTGYEAAGRYRGKRFDDVEPELRTQFERTKGASRMTWDRAKFAARAAWDRIERAMPGDVDRDGR